MENDFTQIDEVVVTALDIEREKKSLGYATTEVSGEEITTVTQENPINALAGRVPGLTLNETAGVGTTVSVMIRGMNYLTNNNKPLFSIKGAPVDRSMNNIEIRKG